MKRILLDTNVVLDVLLDRAPHAAASAAVWAAIERRFAQGVLAAHAVTTIHYLARRELGAARAGRLVREVLSVFAVAAVDGKVLDVALGLGLADFEDAVTAAAARAAGCDAIVSRDPKGFRKAGVTCLLPEACVALLAPVPGS